MISVCVWRLISLGSCKLCRPTGDGRDLASTSSGPNSDLKLEKVKITLSSKFQLSGQIIN